MVRGIDLAIEDAGNECEDVGLTRIGILRIDLCGPC